MTCPASPDSSPSMAAPGSGALPRSARRRSRWWLAGLLVGCLLPAALVHAEAMRLAERLTQICLMAPDAIRAESRRVARRKPWKPLSRSLSRRRRRLRMAPRAALGVPSAGHDVLNRRGPPRLAI